MRKSALAGSAVLALTLLLTACGGPNQASTSSMSPSAQSQMQTMPSTTDTAASRMGSFMGLNQKMVAGSAKLSGSELMLTGFSSDEGPDLHVYLTNGTDEAAVMAGKSLGAVSFNEAAQTFMLQGVDASAYKDVVIHCDKAKAVFGAAALGS